MDRLGCKLRIDVTRSQVYDTDNRLAREHRQCPEVAIVSHNNAAFSYSMPKYVDVKSALKICRGDIQHIKSLRAEKLNNGGMDILIGQQLEVPQLQVWISAVVKISFRMAFAE